MQSEYEKCEITVITGDAKTLKTEDIRTCDHNNPSHRVWLAKHCWWAMRNGKIVTTMPSELYDASR